MLSGITDHDLPVVQGVAIVFVLFQMAMSLAGRHQLRLPQPQGAGGVSTIDSSDAAPSPRARRCASGGANTAACVRFLSSAGVVLAIGWLVLVIVCAIFAPWIAPHDPNAQNLPTRLGRASAPATGSGPTTSGETCSDPPHLRAPGSPCRSPSRRWAWRWCWRS